MPGEPISKKISEKASEKRVLSRFARFRIGLSLAWHSVKNFFRRLFRYFFPLKVVTPLKASIDVPPLVAPTPVVTPVTVVAPPRVIAPRTVIPKPAPPPPPLWWTLSDEAYQQKCNAAVQNAVKENLKGHDFVISGQEAELHQRVYDKLRVERNRLFEAAKYNWGDLQFQQAQEKWDNLPTLDFLQSRHIQAFNNAIAQYGQDYDFRVNGFCLQNIHDVRGTNNNCGANSLFHILLENLEKFSMDNAQDKSFLGALREKLVEGQQKEENNLLNILKKVLGQENKKKQVIGYDAVSIKKYILEKYPGHAQQDKLFGPVIRAHVAKILSESQEYQRVWETTILHQIDEQWDPITVDSSYFAEYISSVADGVPNAQYAGLLFQDYYNRLGNENNCIMLTVDEIAQYAHIMNFKLNVYALREDGLYHPYANPSDTERAIERFLSPPKFAANIVNIGAYHWQYDVTPSRYAENNKPTRKLGAPR